MRLPASNVFWSGLEAVVSAGFSFASAFVVAGIVGPQEVGVGAAALAVHVLLWIAVNSVFADAIVQRPAADQDQFSSAFWAAILVGALGGLLQVGLGWPLAAALDDHRLVAMSLVLAAPLPIVGAGGVMQGMLTRNRQYQVLAGRAVIGQGLGTLCGILCALGGAGAWSLVVQQTVTSTVGAALLIGRSRWRPARVFQPAKLRALLAVGLPLTISTLVQQGRYRLFTVLIGATAGPAALGQVHMAFRLVDTMRDLAITALWRLILPVLAQRQADLPVLRASLARIQALSCLVLFPAAGGMLVCMRPVVQLLLGPPWEACSDAAIILLGMAFWIFLAFPCSVALVARGRVDVPLLANLATLLLTAAGVLAFAPHRPLQAALIWIAAQIGVAPYTVLMTKRELALPVAAQLQPAAAPLLLAVLASGLAWALPALVGLPPSPALLIAVRLGIGGAVYALGALLLLRAQIGDAIDAIGLRGRTTRPAVDTSSDCNSARSLT